MGYTNVRQAPAEGSLTLYKSSACFRCDFCHSLQISGPTTLCSSKAADNIPGGHSTAQQGGIYGYHEFRRRYI
jgi:hypothetical protein